MQDEMAFTRGHILAGYDLAAKTGIEIGPLNRPIVRRSDAKVFYCDHCSTEGLKEKYRDNGAVCVDDIQAVDFDMSQCSFDDIKNRLGCIDFVVASHVVEHIPDLVSWFEGIAGLLNDDGALLLVVPDKRFTFDLHRRVTPFWQIKQAHDAKIWRPSLHTVVDHFNSIVAVDPAGLWADYVSVAAGAGEGDGLDRDVSHVYEIWKAGHYIDTHCLVTTPWHFVETVGKIAETYDLPLTLDFINPTPAQSFEFYVRLTKSRSPTDWSASAREVYRGSAHPEIAE